MPIGTPTTQGSTASSTIASSYNHTTVTNAAPSGAKIFVCVTYLVNSLTTTTTTVTGGSLSWTRDKEQGATNATFSIGIGGAIHTADAASGLGTGVTLNVAAANQLIGCNIVAFYVTGLAAQGAVIDGTDGRVRTTGTTAWDTQATTAPNTTQASTILVSSCLNDAASTSVPSTATYATHAELFDIPNPNSWNHTTTHAILSSTGAVRLTGTWSSSGGGSAAGDVALVAAYKESGGTVQSPIEIVRSFEPARFGPF